MSHRLSGAFVFCLFLAACGSSTGGGAGDANADARVAVDSSGGVVKQDGAVADARPAATDSVTPVDAGGVLDGKPVVDSKPAPDSQPVLPDAAAPDAPVTDAATDKINPPDLGAPDNRVADASASDARSPNQDTAPVLEAKKTLYVATDGSDSADGSKDKPLATIKKAASLADKGTLIYVRGGTYALTGSLSLTAPAGSAQEPIRLWAYPGEHPVLDFAGAPSGAKGLSVDASYWHVKGFEVKNAPGRGIQVSTGTGMIIENCDVHHNGDMGVVVSNGASYVTVLNVDSHHNFDDAAAGENADGFGAKNNVGVGVVFRGCRSFANADDGWDLYGAGNAVRFENCWAYKNGENVKNVAGFAGDGNGFKLGKPANDLASHVLVNCLAWGNLLANGYEDNDNPGGVTYLNNVSYKNKGTGFEAVNLTAKHVVKNNISLGDAKPANILAGEESNNSWDNGFSVSEADFLSLDDSIAIGPRQADGSLPVSDFLHLKPTSALVDKGAKVDLPYLGAAPDLGAYEAK